MIHTDLSVSDGEPWNLVSHAVGQTPDCPGHQVPQAVVRLRRIGWIDQRGNVFKDIPPSNGFHGGSLTPLLVNPGCD